MKTKSVKAVVMAITIICLVGTMCFQVLAYNGKNEYVSSVTNKIKEQKINIEPMANVETKPSPEELEIEIDVEELKAINEAKRLEEERKQQEEEQKRKEAEEQRKMEEEQARKAQIVYDGMNIDELANKLNRSLNSDLAGQGYTFAKLSTELGIDPYLSLAIVLHETGCKWKCSNLLRQCNNVGGMKGSPGCNGGSYASFPSLEEGIRAYMNNLYKNYFSQGLTTPETIGPKYAASTTWASQVNAYINDIKAA